jgi:putative salt-induced outer membrane protein YdiY
VTIVTGLLVLAPIVAAAQAPPPPPPPPPAREGTAEFAFVSTTGNASTATIGLAGELTLRPPSWLLRTRAAFVRNESEDVLTAETFLYTFRAERGLTPRLSAFAQFDYFRDEFAGVNHRNGVLGGLSYKVLEQPAHLFTVDAGLGYLDEQRLRGDDVSSATYGLGAGYRWKISPTAEFADDLRLTGTFAAGEDWRIAQVASITARINALFSLKLSNTIRFVNAPVPGFEDTDTLTSVALVAKF